jgi:hypothetical protein
MRTFPVLLGCPGDPAGAAGTSDPGRPAANVRAMTEGVPVTTPAHDEGENTPLAADVSLWKFLRSTGVPPVGASEPDVDAAFDRIIRGASERLRLAEALQEIAAYADDFPASHPLQRVRDMAMDALSNRASR